MNGLVLIDTAMLVSATVSPVLIDTFESYDVGCCVGGENGGFPSAGSGSWGSAYVDRSFPTGLQASDDFESATVGESINGGTSGDDGFSGSYRDASLPTGVQASDDMESYTESESPDGDDGGGGFSSGYTNKDY